MVLFFHKRSHDCILRHCCGLLRNNLWNLVSVDYPHSSMHTSIGSPNFSPMNPLSLELLIVPVLCWLLFLCVWFGDLSGSCRSPLLLPTFWKLLLITSIKPIWLSISVWSLVGLLLKWLAQPTYQLTHYPQQLNTAAGRWSLWMISLLTNHHLYSASAFQIKLIECLVSLTKTLWLFHLIYGRVIIAWTVTETK